MWRDLSSLHDSFSPALHKTVGAVAVFSVGVVAVFSANSLKIFLQCLKFRMLDMPPPLLACDLSTAFEEDDARPESPRWESEEEVAFIAGLIFISANALSRVPLCSRDGGGMVLD